MKDKDVHGESMMKDKEMYGESMMKDKRSMMRAG